jgi:geranylgeranylglycerol-phosphate geranylgeranyltransferase
MTHSRLLLAWFRLMHPFPSVLVTLAGMAFTVLARGGGPPARVLLVGCALLSMQFAIGSANDVLDRELDAVTKPWKPLARGAISPVAASLAATTLSLCSLFCAVLLGPAALAADAVCLGCGLSYDLWLKRTGWSWLPYCVALPTLPQFAWAVAGRFEPRLLLAYPLGFLIGLSLHLANTLPDLEGDHAFGIRGLAHALGRRRALLLCYGSLCSAQALTLALAPLLQYRGWGYPAGLAASLLLTVAAALVYRLHPVRAVLQWNFGLLAFAALALSLGWLAGAIVE